MNRRGALIAVALLLAGCSYHNDYILDGTIRMDQGVGEEHVYGNASEGNGQLETLRFLSEKTHVQCDGNSIDATWGPDSTSNTVKNSEKGSPNLILSVPVSCNNGETGKVTLKSVKFGYTGQGEIGKSTVSFRLIWDQDPFIH